MTKLGADFEKAVFTFAKTLDPAAEVLFDHKAPDRDTGTPRQCDVWINAKFGGHWPLSILVSCKDHNTKLDIGDIGTFCDEVRSSRASTGVIYSRAGFTKPALEKAKSNGVACCRLYQNEPADIPSSIVFEHFACTPQIRLALQTDVSKTQLKTWNDIFDIPEGNMNLLDVIASEFAKGENASIQEGAKQKSFPLDWEKNIVFITDDTGIELKVQLSGHWKWYRARLEATLLDGSYCLSDESFKGTLIGPTIDLRGEHPGEAWVEITDRSLALPTNRILAVLYQGDVKTALRENVGPQTVT